MRRLFALLLSVLVAAPSQAALKNQLLNHSAPYLALHGTDPTAWQHWSTDAIAEARRRNRLLFVSVGYFSCHWCHVMQRESYRNTDIAGYLNDHFIPVKVDRELEPALDAHLIGFAEKTLGYSGWPLNVFLTPDGHPLYAVLYMPPQEFLAVLNRLQVLWQQDPESLRRVAKQAAGGGEGPGAPRLAPQRVQGYAAAVMQRSRELGDPLSGGFGEQSRFPSAPQLEFMLRHLALRPDQERREFLQLTLDHMARLGLQDHLGGGFFRYTVDPGWRTPHFEKMLYDNALLAQLYLKAARQFGRDDYRAVGHRTLDFMADALRSREGALMASLSAVDSRNIEGGYYLWTRGELGRLLDEDELSVYREMRGIRDSAPFEEGYLPLADGDVDTVARRLKKDSGAVAALLASADAKLLSARTKRVLPTDTKLLAGWNGLALSAFVAGAEGAGGRYEGVARGIRDYLVNQLWDGRTLARSKVNGKPVGRAALEDYAYVGRGLVDWAQHTGRAGDRAAARAVIEQGWTLFYTKSGWRLSADSIVPLAPPEDIVSDGPMPSPSAILIGATLKLGRMQNDRKLREQAVAALNSGHAVLQSDPFWYATHVRVMLDATTPAAASGLP